jgi:serine-type D-Ala-D-Ala carboxypeptidase (penicillin-binding protein 5/6)
VHLGDAESVGLVPAEDVRLLVPALVQDSMTAEVVYNGPLIAPVTKGSAVAELVVHVPDLPDRRVPLVAEADVGKAGFLKRFTTAGRVLYRQYIGSPAS